jgi:hypothetical protein
MARMGRRTNCQRFGPGQWTKHAFLPGFEQEDGQKGNGDDEQPVLPPFRVTE